MSDEKITILLYGDHPDVPPFLRGLRPRCEPERDPDWNMVDPRFEEVEGTAAQLISRFSPLLRDDSALHARVAREVLSEVRALGHEVAEDLLPEEADTERGGGHG